MTDLTRRAVLAGSGLAIAAATVASAAPLPPARPLAGKSILITGASSGFGNLGAVHYARLGAKVFATMRNLPRAEGDALRAAAQSDGLDITVLELDVLSDDQVARAVSQAETAAGGALDILVNNAGIVIGGPVELQGMDAVQLAFDTNVLGYQRLGRAVLPAMRARKAGLIFNVSSQVGRVVFPGMGIYSATKFAVESMSEQLAYEVAPHGIEVVIIQPGGYRTRVGENRARYTQPLLETNEAERLAAYPAMVEQMRAVPSAIAPRPGDPDPMDIPLAIAEIAQMPAGTRPLRRAVHPGRQPQLEINRVSRETQLSLLGDGPLGPWVKAVLD